MNTEPIYESTDGHLFRQFQLRLVLQMQVGNQFSNMLPVSLSVFLLNDPRIGGVVKACDNHVAFQDIIAIFTFSLADNLGYPDRICSMSAHNHQDRASRRMIVFSDLTVSKLLLDLPNQFSKVSWRCRYQSRMPS